MEQFTIEQIRIYLMSKDTLGDAISALSPEAVKYANENESEEMEQFIDS